ncbi:MAG TPA: putative F420-0 ABC transporter substrate-binding protein [Cellulomonas sp.]
MSRRRTIAVATAALVALVVPLAACSTGTGTGGASSGPTPAATTPAATTTTAFRPVTVDNCGTSVTVAAPPSRVVTIKSTPTEMMLALGLGDRIVGEAYQDGPVPDQWASAAAGIPVLSDKIPGQEAVLALDPDFVYAGWESNVTADGGVGDRAALAARGIGTYVSPSACKEPSDQPDPLTFDDVFSEITEVGNLFGVPDKASALVASQKSDLAAIKPVSGVSAFWWSSGGDTPYAGAGIGAPQLIMSTAGVTNILANVHDTWTSAGWEQVVAADPDVIVLVDASWNTYDHKVQTLESNPALSQLTAVKDKRFVRLPFAATEAGVRNVEAAASLAQQVRDLGLGG